MRRLLCIAKAALIIILLLTDIAFAGEPVDGIYEKQDENGRLMAKLIIMSPQDKFNSNWSSAGGAPYVGLLAYDEDGEQYEISTEYIWKTEKQGAFERGAYFSRDDIAKMKQFKLATGKRYRLNENLGEMMPVSGQKVKIVIHCGDKSMDKMLSGTYERTGDAEGTAVIPSMLMFICEMNYAPEIYYSERNIPCSCRIIPSNGRGFPFEMTEYEMKKGSVAANEYYVDNKFRIVMKSNSIKREFSFPYVSKDYLESSAAEWNEVKPVAAGDVNALTLHHFLMSRDEFARLLTKNSVLRFVDFFSGKGKHAITTCEYLLVEKNPDGTETKKLRASVQDNGNIEIIEEY